MADSPPPSSTGLTFAHYEVRRREDGTPWELGRGAMGVTYQAHDPQLRIDVALKVINPAQVGDAKARALFLREARAAARVHHANVGNVVFLNPDPENMFYAMEFIAGESLRDWMHSRVPLSPLMTIGLSLQIARGLEAIHREGVIHRDLKPTNLMIVRADKLRKEHEPEAWQIKIIDFGLARNLAGDVSETSAVAGTTGFRGTALYASPEQCEERRDLDGRSDLYSLGCVMWEMLVGMPPFRANVHRELLNAHVAKPPPLQQLSHLPQSLQAVVARLVAKDREGRFADAGAVIAALERCREQILRGEGPPPGAWPGVDETIPATTYLPPPAAPPPAGAGRIGRKEMFAAAALVLVALGALLVWKNGWFGAMHGVEKMSAQWDSPVIAILPFDFADARGDELRVAEALTGEVIDRVSKLPGTRVISRGAIMAYRSVPGGPARKRIRAIDAELGGASAVLESSVGRQGDNVKINSVLYDAKTEQRLWGQTYLRDWRDVAAAQKEVPEQITRALRTRLEAAKRETSEQRAAAGPTAADLFFQTVPMESINKERNPLLVQVIAKDSKFADAHAELALGLLAKKGAENTKLAEASLRQALALDPDSVPGLLYLADLRWAAGANEEADALLGRALALAPYDFHANVYAALRAKRRNQPGESYAYARRAHTVNPEFSFFLMYIYYLARDFQLTDLAEFWLAKKSRLTNDPQLQELIAIQGLMLRKDFSGALNRLRLLPPDLAKDVLSVAAMTYDAAVGAGEYETALALVETSPNFDLPMDRDFQRAELLFRLGRLDAAREAAARVEVSQTADLEGAKAAGEAAPMGHFRLAKALQILGRPAEALAQIEEFVKVDAIQEVNLDASLFRENPRAIELLQARFEKERARRDLVAKQILEIEKSYSWAAAGAVK